jgi:hypothetical protein
VLRPCEAPASHTCRGLTAVGEQVKPGRQTDPSQAPSCLLATSSRASIKMPDNPVSDKVSGRLKKNHGIVWESSCARCAGRRRNSFTAKKVPVPEQSADGAERPAALRRWGQPLAVQGDVGERRQGNRQTVEAHLAGAPPSHTWRGPSLFAAQSVCGSVCCGPVCWRRSAVLPGSALLPAAQSA